MKDGAAFLVQLIGRRVSLALCDGARIDDVPLLSAPRPDDDTIWFFAGGTDRFVPISEVVDIWEAAPSGRLVR